MQQGTTFKQPWFAPWKRIFDWIYFMGKSPTFQAFFILGIEISQRRWWGTVSTTLMPGLASLLQLPSVLLCRQFLAPFSFLISAREPDTSTECKSCFILAPCETTWIFIWIALLLASWNRQRGTHKHMWQNALWTSQWSEQVMLSNF